MRFRPLVLPLAFLPTLLVYPGPAALASTLWQVDGVPLCTAVQYQTAPAIVADGSGGAIVAWVDYRDNDYNIYAQRIDASGAVLWTSDGLPICVASGAQDSPRVVSDGVGGAIVTWQDYRSGAAYDIYAQRINGSGVVQWASDGISVSAAIEDQKDFVVAPDGAHGEFIAWVDARTVASSDDIYAQRIDGSGTSLWTSNGIPLCTAAFDQLFADITSDGAGGIIVVWNDNRFSIDYAFPTYDVFAQRVNGAGAVQWTTDGVPVCVQPCSQTFCFVATDGAGGALVTWSDARACFGSTDVYAQRLSPSGAPLWALNGVALCTAPRVQNVRAIIADGAGGAVISWNDNRSVSTYDIYSQRVNGAGVAQWAVDGIPVSVGAGDQNSPLMISAAPGNEIVAWTDSRNGNPDVYAQHVDPAGSFAWTANGVPVVANSAWQSSPAMTSDGNGGAILAWEDSRGNDVDIYAVRIGPSGLVPTAVGGPAPSPRLVVARNHPNPFSQGTTIDVTLRHEEVVDIEVFDAAGRRVRSMEEGRLPAGAAQIGFDGLDSNARALANGVYFCRIHAGRETATTKIVIAR